MTDVVVRRSSDVTTTTSTRTRTRTKRRAEDRRAHGYVDRLRLVWCGSRRGHSVPKVGTTHESYHARRRATKPRRRIALSWLPIVSSAERSQGTRTGSRLPDSEPAESTTGIWPLRNVRVAVITVYPFEIALPTSERTYSSTVKASDHRADLCASYPMESVRSDKDELNC